MNKEERRQRAQGTLEGSVWGLRQAGVPLEEVLAIVRNASTEWDPSPEPAFVIEEAGPPPITVGSGSVTVVMRRMDALKAAIDSGSRFQVEFTYDEVRRALTKAFGLSR